MKKICTLLFFICLFLSLQNDLKAQGYITAAGIRLGDGIGMTVQQRVLDRWTVEGILHHQLKRNETVITGLIERHLPLISRRLNFYVGGGLHKGWTDNDKFKNPFGVTTVAGFELAVKNVNVSLDFKPAINITGGRSLVYAHKAVSLRYIFIKDNKLEQFQRKRKKKKRKRQKARKKRRKGKK